MNRSQMVVLKFDEIFLRLPLVEEKEDIDLVHRLDGLHRHVIGISRRRSR